MQARPAAALLPQPGPQRVLHAQEGPALKHGAALHAHVALWPLCLWAPVQPLPSERAGELPHVNAHAGVCLPLLPLLPAAAALPQLCRHPALGCCIGVAIEVEEGGGQGVAHALAQALEVAEGCIQGLQRRLRRVISLWQGLGGSALLCCQHGPRISHAAHAGQQLTEHCLQVLTAAAAAVPTDATGCLLQRKGPQVLHGGIELCQGLLDRGLLPGLCHSSSASPRAGLHSLLIHCPSCQGLPPGSLHSSCLPLPKVGEGPPGPHGSQGCLWAAAQVLLPHVLVQGIHHPAALKGVPCCCGIARAGGSVSSQGNGPGAPVQQQGAGAPPQSGEQRAAGH